MQPNERLKRGAKEFMLFPGTSWSCAQYWGPGTYSHCCGYPLDWTGGDLYAPCTVRSAGCIDPATNCELWYSTDTVWVPGSKEPVYVAFQVGHSESMRGRDTVVPQGAYLNSMGTFMGGHSGGCGLHAHIEFVNLGPDPNATTGFVNGGCQGVISAAGSTAADSVGAFTKAANSCFRLTGSKPYYEVCFMNDTANDGASPHAQHHQYAKGLSWFVPQESRSLAGTDDELYNNMRCVYGFFKCLNNIENLNDLYLPKTKPWTDGAIAGMLANMQNESSVNPNRWEGDTPYGTTVGGRPGGYGLVQWTPYTNIINALKAMSPVDNPGAGNLWTEAQNYDATVLGNAECQTLFFEYCQEGTGGGWMGSPSWDTWAHSDVYDSEAGASTAAMIFQRNYERPFSIDSRRGPLATEIYQRIKTEKWDAEMPAGKLSAEIVNPWDLATPIENGRFRVREDFVPVYWCPYDTKKKDPITFSLSHYMFAKNGVLPYEKVYYGPGGFPSEAPEKAVVSSWFAWSKPGDNSGHYFSPAASPSAETTFILLEPFVEGKTELDINKDFYDVCFTNGTVEDPYSKKILFSSNKLPISYDLVQTGSYDEKAAQKVKVFNSIAVFGSKKGAVDTMADYADTARTVHFFVDSKNIIQALSLDRRSCNEGAYSESALTIFLTNNAENLDMEYAQELIAELFYYEIVKYENLDKALSLMVATGAAFDESLFRKKVKEKMAKLRQEEIDKLQFQILVKIKSQQKYETYLNRLDYILERSRENGL